MKLFQSQEHKILKASAKTRVRLKIRFGNLVPDSIKAFVPDSSPGWVAIYKSGIYANIKM